MLTKNNRKFENIGPCHICGRVLPLSKDHVPPQGAVGTGDVVVSSAFPDFVEEINRRQAKIVQGGLSYYTPCKPCNSLLGKYDRALIEVAEAVRQALESGPQRPASVSVRTRPGALCRAILGHILVAKPDINKAFDRPVGQYILDETGSTRLPEDIGLFFWPYPYKLTHINPELVTAVRRGQEVRPATLRLLKSYPVAYMVADLPSYGGMGNLTPFAALGPKEFSELVVPLSPLAAPDWPENAPIKILTAGGVEAVYSRPREDKRKAKSGQRKKD